MTPKQSLRQRLFWWSVITNLAIVTTVFVLVGGALDKTIREEVRRDLLVGVRIVAELQSADLERGVERAARLASEPTLRAAVETGDAATIRANLRRLAGAPDEVWLAVVDPSSGSVTATAAQARAHSDRIGALAAEARYYDTADIWVTPTGVLEVSASSLMLHDTPAAVLLSARRIGSSRIRRLEALSGHEVVVVAGTTLAVESTGQAAASRFRSGGAPWGDSLVLPSIFQAVDGGLDALEPFDFVDGAETWVGAGVSIPDLSGAPAADLVVYQSLDVAMAPVAELREQLALIGVAGVLLTFLLSAGLARGITRPIQRLLAATVQLASGDLDRPIQPEGRDELGRLAEGFEQMRQSLRAAQEDLVRAETLSAVGQAASAIVHDFGQPLAVIQGHVQLLEEDLDDPKAREEDLREIQVQVARLGRMMREVLEFARGGDRLEIEVVAVEDLLEQLEKSVRMAAERDSVRLRVQCDASGAWSLDFSKTIRILENLVRNAVAAIGHGGQVWVTARSTGSSLELEVRDDGPGIPESLHDTLFEPFVTHGKKGGTGLGLAIVRKYTEAQNGTIRVETSGDGTSFVLAFPRADHADPSSTTPSAVRIDTTSRSRPNRVVGAGGSTRTEPRRYARTQ